MVPTVAWAAIVTAIPGIRLSKETDSEEIMKKRVLCTILLGALAGMMLTGCGDGSESVPDSSQAMQVTGEPVPSDAELGIMNYENMYSEGTMTAEDYKALARLYGEAGRVREQRDMLEQCRRLYQDQEAFELLQGIAVNAAEESKEIRDQADILYQAFDIPEYLDDGINAMITDAWFSTMMPKLKEGKRSYFQQKDAQSPFLYVEAGYGADGLPYGSAWYVTAEGKVTSLYKSGTMLRWVQTSLVDGTYQGAFESWLCIGATGDIYHETGTLEQGQLAGEYTAQIHTGEAASDLFSLWSNREGMEFTSYAGSFEAGHAAAEQPSEAARKKALGEGAQGDLVAYAYDEAKENYLFVTVEGAADAAAYAFDTAALGLAAYPGFTYYEAQEDGSQDMPEGGENAGASGTEDSGAADGGTAQSPDAEAAGDAAPRIRIYDSEIQWFDGKKWTALGTVGSYQLEDPFRTYAEEKAAADAALGNQEQSGTGSGGASVIGAGMLSDRLSRRGTAQVAKEPQKPADNKTNNNKTNNTTNNNKTNNNTKPPAPAPTPAPSTPEPSQPADNGGNNGGGNDSGGGDNGGGDNGGGNSGGGDNGGGNDSGGGDNGGGNSGGDVDIEWTDDIL